MNASRFLIALVMSAKVNALVIAWQLDEFPLILRMQWCRLWLCCVVGEYGATFQQGGYGTWQMDLIYKIFEGKILK